MKEMIYVVSAARRTFTPTFVDKIPHALNFKSFFSRCNLEMLLRIIKHLGMLSKVRLLFIMHDFLHY